MSVIPTSPSVSTRLFSQASAGVSHETHKTIFYLSGTDKRPFNLRCPEQKLQGRKNIEHLEYCVFLGTIENLPKTEGYLHIFVNSFDSDNLIN